MPDDLERQDYEALLATRGELGPSYDRVLVDSFGLGIAWTGIAIVNVAHALQGRRRD